jgi:hypothetical protein
MERLHIAVHVAAPGLEKDFRTQGVDGEISPDP